jgi:hypothetical protein
MDFLQCSLKKRESRGHRLHAVQLHLSVACFSLMLKLRQFGGFLRFLYITVIPGALVVCERDCRTSLSFADSGIVGKSKNRRRTAGLSCFLLAGDPEGNVPIWSPLLFGYFPKCLCYSVSITETVYNPLLGISQRVANTLQVLLKWSPRAFRCISQSVSA